VLVASAAFAAFAATSDTGTSASSQGPAPSGAAGARAPGTGPPAGRAPFAAALAAKLGVAQSKVEAALQSVRQQLGSGQARPSPWAFETALAKALGVNRGRVAAALQSLRPPGPPPGAQSGQPSPQGGQPQPPLQSS
jgi:hypothetical protein